jgi:branched-chain amino acid transport system permease protein
MVIRAGVENRSMVTALGIDVRKSFTLVFAIGGAAAGIGGGARDALHDLRVGAFSGRHSDLRVHRDRRRRPRVAHRAAVASVLVAVLQQFANFYLGGTGDFIVVILLALVLLVRPAGLLGRKA